MFLEECFSGFFRGTYLRCANGASRGGCEIVIISNCVRLSPYTQAHTHTHTHTPTRPPTHPHPHPHTHAHPCRHTLFDHWRLDIDVGPWAALKVAITGMLFQNGLPGVDGGFTGIERA